MLKKTISVLLALIMVFGIFTIIPFPAFAETSGQCGDDVYWSLSDGGVLTISGTGDMYDYSFNDQLFTPWFGYWENIERAIVENGVTNIGDCAFAGLQSLMSISITNSVSIIGDYAFDSCYSLTEIEIPETVNSMGSYAFNGCRFENVSIPKNVTMIGYYTFSHCENLKSIEIPDSVTAIGSGAFSYCKSLASIVIPNTVTSIGSSSFSHCDSLTNIDIPDSVNNIGDYAFSSCECLTGLDIPDTVSYLGNGVFHNCKKLISVVLPYSIVQISRFMFFGCVNLKSVYIGKNVRTIGRSAFSGCEKLTDIYYGGSEDDWYEINIGGNNSLLYDVTINYNCDHGFNVLGEHFTHRLSVYAKELNSMNYHPELAHLMMTMANAAYDPARAKRGYEELGMEHWIPVNYEKTGSVYGTENVCFNIGSLVDDDGTIIMLLALRGSGDITDIKQGTLDWLGDFDLDSALQVGVTPHLNFNTAANHVYEAINVYLDAIHNTSVESGTNIKYFITGHSRGGAVANLLECKLDARVGTSNVYGYNFAVPDTVKANSNANIELFNNIFNVSNLQDPVSYVPGHIVDTMTAIPQWYATGRIDNRWQKLGRSVWFKDEDGSIDGSAHDPDRYVKFMRSRNSISAYTDTPKFHLSPTLFSIGPFLGVGYKIYATYCPVNVELVDENGKVIASVIDGVIDYHDSHFGEVIVTTEDDHKMFAVPSDKNYTLRMVGSDSGTLDYYVAETNLISEETDVLKVYEGVALETGKEMVGKAVNVIDSDDQMVHEDKLITVEDEPMEILTDGEEVPYTFSYILGDSDDSGEVETIDATWLQRFIADFATPYDFDTLMHGDVDYDGEADITDVTMIQRYLAQFSTPYLIGADVIL